MDPDHLVLVHFNARLHEHLATLLRGEQRVRRDRARLERHQAAVVAAEHVAGPLPVLREDGVQDTRAAGGREDGVTQTNQTAGGHPVLHRALARGVAHVHVEHLALARGQQVHHASRVLLRHLHGGVLPRLEGVAGGLVLLGDDAGRADGELEPLAPHVLDQDGNVQRTASAHHKHVGRLTVLDAEGQVALQLLHETVADVTGGDVLSLLAREGRSVHAESHAHSWLLHLDGG
mmetsp:Transcript_38303/g.64342  ORF Transcript_38303/g.64342 Transcript_38303/m.64342 type:complete len:233 (+) Transcript_38303:437-1135(+)